MEILLILLAVLLPPVAVFVVTGISFELFLAFVLTILGYIPGVIYALWIVLSF